MQGSKYESPGSVTGAFAWLQRRGALEGGCWRALRAFDSEKSQLSRVKRDNKQNSNLQVKYMNWEKIKGLFGRSANKAVVPSTQASTPTPTQSSQQSDPEIPVIPESESPWAVPLFDVRPFTLNMMSTSQDPQCAANAVSFGQDDGTSFIGQATLVPRSVPISLHFRLSGPLHEGVLFTPRAMEEKWAIFFRQQKIICVRSWTRQVAIVAHVRITQGMLEIQQVEGSFSGEDESPEFTLRMLDCLLRTHVQDVPFPVPLPDFLANDPLRAAMWCFSTFGNRATCATASPLPPSMATKPLRTYSLLHIASAKCDLDGMRHYLDTIPVDAPDKDGRTPLHWALASNQLSSAPLLLDSGASIDAQSDEGATPLMEAVQRKSQEQVDFLLGRGADANALDFRGFSSLHRAAEMGLIDIVRSLLKHGANPHAESHGHTPASLAQARAHADIVALMN